VAVNEVVDLAKKAEQDCLICKVDFERSYDSVSWGFLEYLLKRIGFDDKWCAWMQVGVFASISQCL
jgi:hypothetical protein